MTNEEAIGVFDLLEKTVRNQPGFVYEALSVAYEALKNARPHGKWIKEDKPWGGFGDRVLVNTCPFCKESFVYHGNNPKFCSECGADMRGGQDNDPN